MPRKNNSTPIKPSEGSAMTHEDEELQHDVYKLQEQVHQILLEKSKSGQTYGIRKSIQRDTIGKNFRY